MLKKILIVLAAIVAVFLIVVALQPAEYQVVRTAVIPAPAATVFGLVNDFRKWELWSPWAKLDPAAKNTFEGPESGPGAVFKWSGNNKVGEGQMTLLESQASELIKIKLEFIKPFASSCSTDFSFKPEESGTAVTWSMSGRNGFFEKAMCLFMSMDKMIGGDFERGLGLMKEAVSNRKTEI